MFKWLSKTPEPSLSLDEAKRRCKEEEVYQQSQQLHQSRRRGLWFRSVSAMTCRNCTFAGFCLQNIKINPDAPPAGFVVLPDAHPELTGEIL